MTETVTRCPHDLAEQETACADGMCPLCLAAEIDLLTELLRAARGLLQFNNILYPDEIDDALEPKP